MGNLILEGGFPDEKENAFNGCILNAAFVIFHFKCQFCVVVRGLSCWWIRCQSIYNRLFKQAGTTYSREQIFIRIFIRIVKEADKLYIEDIERPWDSFYLRYINRDYIDKEKIPDDFRASRKNQGTSSSSTEAVNAEELKTDKKVLSQINTKISAFFNTVKAYATNYTYISVSHKNTPKLFNLFKLGGKLCKFCFTVYLSRFIGAAKL